MISERVQWLIENITKEDGTHYTHLEIQEGTRQLGHEVTNATISKLRSGATKNPTFNTLRVLALFFNVPVTIFYDDDVTVEDLNTLKAKTAVVTDSQLQTIVLRANDLSGDQKSLVIQLIEEMTRQRK